MNASSSEYRRPLGPSTRRSRAQARVARPRAGRGEPGLGALGLLALLLLWGCASHYDAGRSALDAGRYAEARDEARSGLEGDPGDGPLLLLLARAHLGLEEYERAGRFAEDALASGELGEDEVADAHVTAGSAFAELDQAERAALHLVAAEDAGLAVARNDYDGLLWRGARAAAEGERYEAALRLLRRLRERDPDEPSYAAELPRVASAHLAQMLGRGRYDEAVARADELARAYPELASLQLERGLVRLRLGRDAGGAIEEYVAGGADAAARAARLESVGRALAAMERFDEALAYYDRAVAEDPARPEAHLARLEALVATERWSELDAEVSALAAAAAASPQMTPAEAYVAAFEALVAANRTDEALALLQAHHLEVAGFEVTGYLASAYLRRGQRAQAQAAIEAWERGAADTAGANRAIGVWYVEHGDPLAGADYLARNAARPDAGAADHLALARAYDAAGWAYEMAEALRGLERASDTTDEERREAAAMLARQQLWLEASEVLAGLYQERRDDQALREELVRAYFEAGQPERAEAVLAETVDREGPRAALRAADLLVARGSYRMALPWLERAAADPSTALGANLRLGEAHLALADLDAALAAFDAYVEAADGDEDAWEAVLTRLREAHEHVAAAALLERMVAAHPERTDWALERAARLRDAGLAGAMRDAYLGYVLGAADPGEALFEATLSLERRDERDAAQWLIDEVRAARPELSAVERAQGVLYTELATLNVADSVRGQAYRAAAQEAYRRYLEGSGQGALELAWVGYRLESLGAQELAARAFQAALDAGHPAAPLRLPLAYALLRSGGSTERALGAIRAALSEGAPEGTADNAAAVCYEAGAMEAGAELSAEAMRRADNARLQELAFAAGAEALARDGRHEALVELADTYVEVAFDQRRALVGAANALVRAGLPREARGRAAEGLEQLDGDAELVAVLAEADLQEGDFATALTRMAQVAERSASPWRVWREYAQLLRQRGALEAAGEALARAGVGAGAGRVDLELERGAVAAERGLVDAAVGYFEGALAAADEQLASAERRVAIHHTIDDALRATGHHREADAFLDRALADPALRREFLLVGAEVAAARGDQARAAHSLQAYLDGGGAVARVVDFELARGQRGSALNGLGEIVVEGTAEVGADLLGRYLREAVLRWTPATVEVWIASLERRGADASALRRGLAELYLERGEARRAAALLRELAGSEGALNLALAALAARAGYAAEAVAYLERYDREADGAPGAFTFAAESVLALADPAFVGPQLALLADELATPATVSADIERLLRRGETEAARRRFLDGLAEARLGDGSLDAASAGGALAQFAAAGASDEAAELAAASAGSGVDGILLAIRFGLAAGADVAARVERYERVAGTGAEASLALAEAMILGGAGGAASARLEVALARGSEGQASRALELAFEAARAAGRVELLDAAIERYLEREGDRVGRLVNVALVEQRRDRWESAARRFLQAWALLPGERALLREAVESYARAGRFGEIRAIVDDHPAALDYASVLAPYLGAEPGGSGAAELAWRLLETRPGDLELRLRTIRTELVEGPGAGGDWDGRSPIEALLSEVAGEPIVMRLALERLADVEHPEVTSLARRAAAARIDNRTTGMAADVLWRAGEREAAEEALLAGLDRSGEGDEAGGGDAVATEVGGAEVAPEGDRAGALVFDGGVALGWGRFDLARELAQQALSLDGARVEALALQAVALARLGRIDEALEVAGRYLEASELPAAGLADITAALAENGGLEQAAPLLEQLAASTRLAADGTLRFSGLRAALGALDASVQADMRRRLVSRELPYSSGSVEPLLRAAEE